MLPGTFLHRLSRRSLSQTTVESVIEPLLADFQHEWKMARTSGTRTAVLVRGYLAFWCSMIRSTPEMLYALGSGAFHHAMGRLLMVLVSMLFITFVMMNIPNWVRTGSFSWPGLWQLVAQMPAVPAVAAAALFGRILARRGRFWVIKVAVLVLGTVLLRRVGGPLAERNPDMIPWVNLLGLFVWYLALVTSGSAQRPEPRA